MSSVHCALASKFPNKTIKMTKPSEKDVNGRGLRVYMSIGFLSQCFLNVMGPRSQWSIISTVSRFVMKVDGKEEENWAKVSRNFAQALK